MSVEPLGVPRDPASMLVPDLAHQQSYRQALGGFATGVTIVTAATAQGAVGMTVNSFASVSLDPPLVLWSVGKASGCHVAFEAAEHFTINVLHDNDTGLALRFAGDDRVFDDTLWIPGLDGYPVLRDPLSRFDCTREALHPGGDHTIVVGRVQRFVLGEGRPLLFFQGALGPLGR